MAFFAELKRIDWHCINGIDMIRFYKIKLHKEWYDSLSDDEKELIKERAMKKAEEDDAKLQRAMCSLLFIHNMISDAFCKAENERRFR